MHLLLAVPPNNTIIGAARKGLPLLRAALAERGYNVSFTKYPDEYERERLRVEHPEFYAEMFGVQKRKLRSETS